jgi:hypothetical protein
MGLPASTPIMRIIKRRDMKQADRVIGNEGVSTMVEYLMITVILVTLMMITMLMLNTVMLQEPSDRLNYYAFTDISNGISTRIVDVYMIAPPYGNLATKFDIPDDVAGRSYSVEISPRFINIENTTDEVIVSRDAVSYHTSLAGIGSTLGVVGNTTGSGFNRIRYNSVPNEVMQDV